MAATYLSRPRIANELNARLLCLAGASDGVPSERGPAEQKCDATQRRDKSKAAPARQSQKIEASAEESAAGKKSPSGNLHRFAPWQNRRNDNQCERVPYLIGGGRANPIQRVGRETILQAMGSEGTHGHRDETVDGAGGEPKSIDIFPALDHPLTM